mmetsp:Transcript_14132/g.26725  ORF Transcript_14132/g.26725 Transcript_14132/m.26725 type:complete len:327 (-) Transcript_14132:1828-2808(-)
MSGDISLSDILEVPVAWSTMSPFWTDWERSASFLLASTSLTLDFPPSTGGFSLFSFQFFSSLGINCSPALVSSSSLSKHISCLRSKAFSRPFSSLNASASACALRRSSNRSTFLLPFTLSMCVIRMPGEASSKSEGEICLSVFSTLVMPITTLLLVRKSLSAFFLACSFFFFLMKIILGTNISSRMDIDATNINDVIVKKVAVRSSCTRTNRGIARTQTWSIPTNEIAIHLLSLYSSSILRARYAWTQARIMAVKLITTQRLAKTLPAAPSSVQLPCDDHAPVFSRVHLTGSTIVQQSRKRRLEEKSTAKGINTSLSVTVILLKLA